MLGILLQASTSIISLQSSLSMNNQLCNTWILRAATHYSRQTRNISKQRLKQLRRCVTTVRQNHSQEQKKVTLSRCGDDAFDSYNKVDKGLLA